ncbi:hypothetical protein DUNSADRAFT_3637 [Dunaliella salina]|uniref:RNA-editing substrate-binding complex 6 protein domain-containing protein n=1 Tax=Dunaliella salina TaxID=3046 RepID=A0ABQ7GTP1_DUNSA|nr:hypothetical protein DUNSADRAFT_3637 [Dunaliella salina]|eukprot:KAF5837976.1 hypothetical protein DUNSADRAFT_3637 [Dunaliella salina]
MVRPALLRKTLNLAAAARDGLHQVGTGLQQELGWQDFNLPPGLGNQNSNNAPGPRSPFPHSSRAGRQWTSLHSNLPHSGISPLVLGTQILPALHSHHQHQYSYPHRKPYPLANPPPRPHAPFQKGLPLLHAPPAPKPAGSIRGAPLTAPLVAPAPTWVSQSPTAAAPTTSTSSTAATIQQDGAGSPPGNGVRRAQEGAPQLQRLVGGAGQALRTGEVEAAKDAEAGSALAAGGGHAHLHRPTDILGLEGFVANQAPAVGGSGKGSFTERGGPSHRLTAQQGVIGKLPGQDLPPSGRMEAPFPSIPPPHQQRVHHPAAAMQQPLHPTRKRARGSGVSVALNKSIMSASCVGELLALVRARGHNFDFFNISSAVSRAPKLVEAEHASAKSSAKATPLHACAPASHPPNMYSAEAAVHSQEAQERQPAAPAPASCPANTPHQPPMGEGAKALAAHLYALSLQHLHTFDARGLANTAWAFAKMRYVPDSVLPAALSVEACTRINEFAAQNLSNLAWAMVYMHFRDPHLLGLMANRVLLLLDQFKPQELANIMWAFASLEQHDHTTLSALSARAAQLGPRAFKEQEISNIIWALGRAHHHEGPLLDMLLQETLNKLSSFQPQGVSNIVWALGQLNHASPSLLSAIGQKCSQAGALSAFDNQGLCNLAFGTAVLRFRHPPLMAALADEALVRVASASSAAHKLQSAAHAHLHPGSHDGSVGGREHGQLPSCLTTVLWAATTLEDLGAASKLLAAVAKEVNATHSASTTAAGTHSTPSSITHSWEPTSLAQAAWSCARMQAMMAGLEALPQGAGPSMHHPLVEPEQHERQQQQRLLLLSNLAEAVAARVDRFNGQPLALVVSAFCTPEAGRDTSSSKLVEKLARRVERAAATLSEQQCEVCVEALQQVKECPSAPAALDAIHRRAAALAAVHSSSSSSSSSSGSSNNSMHTAYGSSSTAVSSPGSSSNSSSNSTQHACSTRMQHPGLTVQQGMGAGVHADAQQLLLQQGGVGAAWHGWPPAEAASKEWIGGTAGWANGALPENGAMEAASGLDMAAPHNVPDGGAPSVESALEGARKWGQLADGTRIQGSALNRVAGLGGSSDAALVTAAHAANIVRATDAAQAAQAAYARNEGGVLGTRAAKEEPWASAWPEGLFQDNPLSLLVEAGAGGVAGPACSGSRLGTQATTGGMWSEGGLGNGSVPSISASQLASPSLAAATSSSIAAPSLPIDAASAAGDAGVGSVAADGGLGQFAPDKLCPSELAALVKMVAESNACDGVSGVGHGDDAGLGAASGAAPLNTGMFWDGLESVWGEERAGVRDLWGECFGRSSGADSAWDASLFGLDSCSGNSNSSSMDTSKAVLTDSVAPAAFPPGLAAGPPSAASFAGVVRDLCHNGSSRSSIMDSGFQGNPISSSGVSAFAGYGLKHAPPPYSSALPMRTPLYDSVPHMACSMPHMSTGVHQADSGTGAEFDSINLLPKGLFDLIDEGHHCQLGDTRDDGAMFAAL